MLLLLAAIQAAVRERTGSRSLSMALAGLMLAFSAGLLAFLRPRGDALPAALSLWALLLVQKTRRQPGTLLAAAALFSAAFMTKFSAVAGCAAAILFLNRRGRGVRLALQVLGLSVLALVAVQYLSKGRFLINLWSTGAGGIDLESGAAAPRRFLACLTSDPGLLALFPLAVLTCVRNWRRGRLGLWDLNFLLTAAVLLCVLASPGTSNNHLLELQAACLILVSENLTARPEGLQPGQRWSAGYATVAGILCVLVAGSCFHIAGWKATWNGKDHRVQAVTAAVPADARILSEDSNVPVLLGQRPVVLDPFSFRVLARQGLIDDGPLCERLANREFDVIVLLDRVDLPEPSLGDGLHFSPGVRDAMLRSYHFDRDIGHYYLFVANAAPVTRSRVPVEAGGFSAPLGTIPLRPRRSVGVGSTLSGALIECGAVQGVGQPIEAPLLRFKVGFFAGSQGQGPLFLLFDEAPTKVIEGGTRHQPWEALE